MKERSRREKFVTFLLTPAVIIGIAVIAVFTFRTTFHIEKLRQQSVLEATLSVANEKADRVDRRIVEEDNVVMAEATVHHLGRLAGKWLPTAKRETPTIRAVAIMTADQAHEIVDYATRTPGPRDDVFRRILIFEILPHLVLDMSPKTQLRHLHRSFHGESYLLSYWQRTAGGHTYLIVARHSVPKIVRHLFPRMLRDSTGHARIHVVDEAGRTVFGEPTPTGEFAIGRPFQTTLYAWRLYATLTAAEQLGESVERRRELEMIMVAASFLVVISGIVIVVVAAERERKLAALKSEFVANVSHELKTPLSLVRMFSEMLVTGRVKNEERKQEYLRIIMQESERLTALIENVLDFARAEKGKAAYQFEMSDLNETVERTVELHRHHAEHEGVTIHLRLSPNELYFEFDERAVQMALFNLLDNALKYAKQGKKIDVSLSERSSNFVEIRVRDYGPGISHDEQRHIFNRFVRGTGARSQHVRGSGIGLSLVKNIAKSHGGTVWVEQETSPGAEFVFTMRMRGRRSLQTRS